MQTPIGRGEWRDIAAFGRERGLVLLAAAPIGRHECFVDDPVVSFDALARLQKAKVALVLGNEGQGLRESTLQECIPVGIPMSRGMESLNVGVAGAIYMALFSPCLGLAVRDADSKVWEAGSARAAG
jgi:tRNA G18 (ribose-2'-O)-methylase SpoU